MKYLLFIYFLFKVSILSIQIRSLAFFKKLEKKEIEKLTQEKVHQTCKFGVEKILKTNVKIIGQENIDNNKKYLIVSNHQSIMDIIIYYATLKLNICFIAKASLFYYPFLGAGMKLLRHIPINRSNYRASYQSILEGASRFKEGYSIIIFPEGTRTIEGIAPFKSGSLHLVNNLEEIEILPITLMGTKNIHQKGWFQLVPRQRIKIVIHKPLAFKKEDLNSNQEKKKVLARIEKTIKGKFENDY